MRVNLESTIPFDAGEEDNNKNIKPKIDLRLYFLKTQKVFTNSAIIATFYLYASAFFVPAFFEFFVVSIPLNP